MATFERRTTIEVPRRTLHDWHLRPGAFERLAPPWDIPRVVSRTGSLEDNSMEVELSVKLGPGVHQRWRIGHENYAPDAGFDDVMRAGLFPHWRHEHRFNDRGATASELHDRITYRLPLGPLGQLGGGHVTSRKLERMFAYRHALTAGDLLAHARAGISPMRIAISGATGMLGTALTAYLATAGHTIVTITRRMPEGLPSGDPRAMEQPVIWDPAAGTIDAAALEGVDAVIHLAGEPIAADRWLPPVRWTPQLRDRIERSRVDGTSLLARTIASLQRPPTVLVCASATGWYGSRGDELLDERSDSGEGFLAQVGRAWEAAADPAREAGIRTVHARLGIVLDPRGGALKRMLGPALIGAGGPLGSGRQWWSWIALDDVLGAIEHAVACEELDGPVNVVAPSALRQRDLARVLGRVLRRPAFAPAPAAALRAVLGRGLADELLLASAHIEPRRLLDTGYVFRWPDAEGALRHVLGRMARRPR